jgi:hypothetical protein
MRRIFLLPLLLCCGLLILVEDTSEAYGAPPRRPQARRNNNRRRSAQRPPYRAQNPQLKQLQQALKNLQKGPQQAQGKTTNVSIPLAPEEVDGKKLLRVYLINPPDAKGYDDKGNPIKSNVRKEALGYPGKPTDIKQGDGVTVSFSTGRADAKDKDKMVYFASTYPRVSGTVVSVDSSQIVLAVPAAAAPGAGQKNAGNLPANLYGSQIVQTYDAPDAAAKGKAKAKAKN